MALNNPSIRAAPAATPDAGLPATERIAMPGSSAAVITRDTASTAQSRRKRRSMRAAFDMLVIG
jgi:hypothetical protein